MYQLVPIILLLAIALALGVWLGIPRPRTPVFLWLGILMGWVLAVELVGFISVRMAINNSVLYNVSATLEFLLLLKLLHVHRPAWRRPLVIASVVGVGAMGWCVVYGDPMEFMQVEAILTGSLLLVLFLLAALWDLARTSDEALHRVPTFWLFMGLLLYFGGLVPVIGFIRFVYNNDQGLATQLYLIMAVLCVLRYLITAYACWSETTRTRRTDG